MDNRLGELVRALVEAAYEIAALASATNTSQRAPAPPPRYAPEWSRRMRTAEAASILGISEHALRRQIRAHICADGTAVFDGICAERIGAHYRVRLARRWLTDPAAGAGAHG